MAGKIVDDDDASVLVVQAREVVDGQRHASLRPPFIVSLGIVVVVLSCRSQGGTPVLSGEDDLRRCLPVRHVRNERNSE